MNKVWAMCGSCLSIPEGIEESKTIKFYIELLKKKQKTLEISVPMFLIFALSPHPPYSPPHSSSS